MSRRVIPIGTTALLESQIFNEGEIAYDTTIDRIRIGNAVALGGVPMASDTFLASGAGAVARPLLSRLEDMVSVKDYGATGDGTTDDTAAFTAANIVGRHIYVPPGTYNLESMFTLDALGVGGRTLFLAAGATLTRTTGSSTEPLVWVKNDDCAIIGSGKSSVITSTKVHPEGLVIVGHRNLASAHANVRNCTVSNLKLSGMTNHGATTGSPDKLLVLISSQVGGLVSYFNTITNIFFEKANIGLQFLGDANGNYCADLFLQYIGNPTLSAHRAAFLFEGGLENIIDGFFFHSSPGSSCIKLIDVDNTANGGIVTAPDLNHIRGITEQDPTPSGGIGIEANAGCTGTLNRIDLIDNCPANDMSTTFKRSNMIRLLGSSYDDLVREGKGFIAVGDATNPTDRSSVSLYMDTALQQGVLRTIFEGSDWRRQRNEAREHYFECNGAMLAAFTDKGFGYVAAQSGTVTQATSKSTSVTLSKPTGEITLHAASLAANTTVSFTLTNTMIAAGDMLIIQHVTGGTVGSYTATATAAGGSATIYLRNVTAGALAEAVVLKFVLFKGALAA